MQHSSQDKTSSHCCMPTSCEHPSPRSLLRRRSIPSVGQTTPMAKLALHQVAGGRSSRKIFTVQLPKSPRTSRNHHQSPSLKIGNREIQILKNKKVIHITNFQDSVQKGFIYFDYINSKNKGNINHYNKLENRNIHNKILEILNDN